MFVSVGMSVCLSAYGRWMENDRNQGGLGRQRKGEDSMKPNPLEGIVPAQKQSEPIKAPPQEYILDI